MSEIPEQLKWYTPLRIGAGTGRPNWRVSVDEMTGCIEIKRTSLIHFVDILAVIFFCALISGGLYAAYTYAPIPEEMQIALFGSMVLVSPFLIFVVVMNAFLRRRKDSQFWNGSIRFRFDPQTSELFFPRENVTYRPTDCSKLILGCVRGSEMGILGKRGYGRSPCMDIAKSTQIFMLVFDKAGQWHRHDLSDDHGAVWKSYAHESGSKQFLQVADLLRPHLLFERFVKKYSSNECFDQQIEEFVKGSSFAGQMVCVV
ncbi:MAG: hypothetical protein FWE95_05850 [Planctomycetaceae bacterium]|nr:hypothetical protein [Planctomycetaceae bacterium]